MFCLGSASKTEVEPSSFIAITIPSLVQDMGCLFLAEFAVSLVFFSLYRHTTQSVEYTFQFLGTFGAAPVVDQG
jgi:hypothetical protein